MTSFGNAETKGILSADIEKDANGLSINLIFDDWTTMDIFGDTSILVTYPNGANKRVDYKVQETSGPLGLLLWKGNQ